MPRKTVDVSAMPVMQAKCKTCPFGPNGAECVRDAVLGRILSSASQTCHSTGVGIGKRHDTHLCRGARDVQLQFFAAIGFLPEATDAAWAAKAVKIRRRRP